MAEADDDDSAGLDISALVDSFDLDVVATLKDWSRVRDAIVALVNSPVKAKS